MSRELTTDEVREKFLSHARGIARYWAEVDKTKEECISGAIFSLLVALDGCNIGLPGFIVAPMPHAEDKAFLKGEGKNWWPENGKAKVKADIGGSLHELFYKKQP